MRLHSVVVLAPLLLLSLAHSVGVGAKFVSPTRHGVVSDVSSTIIIVEDAKGKRSSERKRRGEERIRVWEGGVTRSMYLPKRRFSCVLYVICIICGARIQET